MQDDLDDALKVDVLATMLRADQKEAAALVEGLAERLQSVIPDNITIVRAGWVLSSTRPVKQLLVRFDDCHLQIEKDKNGKVTAASIKVVRGVVLKTTKISLDEWVALLAAELSKAAENNASTREALNNLVTG